MLQETDADRARSGHMIAEIPNHDRPRERLVRNGAEHLGDHELLAILLRTGTQGRSLLDLARDVLKASTAT